jgi:hypothetical protein
VRRASITIACAAVAFGNLVGTAPASPSAAASCVGIITSFEGSQLPPASVGREVSDLARDVPSLGRALVRPLAREHGPACG